ncbi:MAG: hypothetical protein K2J20_05830, partial [Bacilli bacterium]|nr:hypothetical protein [Bacilli bacterium]
DLRNYSKDIKYNITSPDAEVNMTNISLSSDSDILAENILIPSGSTQNFTFAIANNNKTTFNLQVKKSNNPKEYFYTTILKNNPPVEAKTKAGSELATLNEGLIEEIDENGLIYYFRGNITNNYVKFADNLWRIVKINSDGTVKIVLNSILPDLTAYNTDTTTYENIANTDIYNALKSYYELNLKNYDTSIANYRFCSETSHKEETSNKTYNAYSRLITNKIPTFSCLGDKYSSKIGLLTADEVMFAGANSDSNNASYYLYNKDIADDWWTSSLASSKSGDFNVFLVNKEGKVLASTSGTTYKGLRPVINLVRKSTVTGEGTTENPYILNS